MQAALTKPRSEPAATTSLPTPRERPAHAGPRTGRGRRRSRPLSSCPLCPEARLPSCIGFQKVAWGGALFLPAPGPHLPHPEEEGVGQSPWASTPLPQRPGGGGDGPLCTVSWISPLRLVPLLLPGAGGVSSLSEPSPLLRGMGLCLRPGSRSGPWECSGHSGLGTWGGRGTEPGKEQTAARAGEPRVFPVLRSRTETRCFLFQDLLLPVAPPLS